MQLSFPIIDSYEVDVRKKNILSSPKCGGSCNVDSQPYLKELDVKISERKMPIQFTKNIGEHVHRWASYVQGFSAKFVQSVITQYQNDYESPVILDPFAGCGTVMVQSKLCGHSSMGTELNPLLQFIADTKVNSWDVEPALLLGLYSSLPRNIRTPAPTFLRSEEQFGAEVLKNLELLKGGIDSIIPQTKKEHKAKDLIQLAFASILIDCSKLKRTPCLGYCKNKTVPDDAPWVLMNKKIKDIASDLKTLQTRYNHCVEINSRVLLANAMEYQHDRRFDLIITSPPYMNGLDYVMNYKIEMAWLGFTKELKDAKKIKDNMVVCDNVSKGLIKNFSQSESKYTNKWLEEITFNIQKGIKRRGNYRRSDMPFIVHKYFDDIYKVMRNVVSALKSGGRFILVVGDSLIADVYVPTDLLLAKTGTELGLNIEKIEKARDRHSGQVRSYILRETIVTLRKPLKGEKSNGR